MKQTYSIHSLMSFLENSPSCFHAISNIKQILFEQDFVELSEKEKWHLEPGCHYYVTRNGSSLIAFSIPESGLSPYRIIASHSDFPCFKLKDTADLTVENHYQKLNVEKYGGMIMSTWLDRPLSIAGRVFAETEHGLCEHLIHLDQDLVLIPNLSIHMNRDANDGYKYNAQKDMLPLLGDINSHTNLSDLLANYVHTTPDKILGHDLYLYNRQKPALWGISKEYLSAPRLDDLECVYGSLLGYLSGEKENYTALYCVFDNEEVGSTTKQGAGSTFLSDTLWRICHSFGLDKEDYQIQLANSFMISADNAHAVHPNHPEKSDPSNKCYLNEGIVLKFNGNQKYCTDGASAAVFRKLCKEYHIPVQSFANRSDMAGGSTLGSIATSFVPIHSVDIGLPQLAMHSAYETVGAKDWDHFLTMSTAFFE